MEPKKYFQNQEEQNYHNHDGINAPFVEKTNSLRIKKGLYFAQQTDNGNSGTAITIDWSRGNYQTLTLTGNCTITFKPPKGPAHLVLKAINFGAYTKTFSPTLKWAGGSAPTFTNPGTDIISIYYDGSTYYASATLNHS